MSKKKMTLEELLEEALVLEEEQPYELPDNWIWVRIFNFIELERGITFPASAKNFEANEGLIGCARTANIQEEFKWDDLIYVDKGYTKENKRKLVKKNDILMSVANSYHLVGKISFINEVKEDITFGGFLLCIRPKNVNVNFLYYYFRYLFLSGKIQQLATQTTNIANISAKKIQTLPIQLPPINEQKRIAKKVESLLSKIDEAKQLIEEAKETFELRRAAIIKTILKEGLSNDKLPTGWRKIKIKDLFTIFGGGTPSKSKEEYWNGKIPWISAKDMKTTFISETMDYITDEGLKNSSAKLAKRGSVAMVVRSGILQRTLPVAFLLSECTVNQDLKVFDSGDEWINKYFMWYVKGNEKSLLHNYSKSGTTVNSIEFEKFKTHEILLPPVDVLKRKIDKVESAIEKEENANEILNIADSIEALKQSILSKAFRGELRTNDPSEENAIEQLKEVLQEQVK
ncbi:restriction endonuclease subunit S [Oceanobacillus sp. FSL K6-0127]|uniref:restriction endonuclease subunit S n=1 Tax=Oceanobacillus sp. FSL K6-0127 TaxID=2921420 RepID=UPI0030ECD9DC